MTPRRNPRVTILLGTAVLLGVVIALVLLLSPGDEAAELNGLKTGFNDNAVTQGVASAEQTAGLIAEVGAEIDRVQISWAEVEPTRGDYHFGTYDEIYRADLARGVEPLFAFAFAPPWAAGETPCDASLPNCHVPPSPEHYADAARTAAVIATRYPKAIAIEIWNEPNTAYFWAPQADPVAYSELLAACYEAIKRVAPTMTVAGASTASGSGATSIPDVEFIGAVLDQGGAESMDALSVHAYPEVGDTAAGSAVAGVEAIRDVEREDGDDDPIWVTETGVSVTGPDAVSEAEQAVTLVNLTDGLAGVDGVEMMLVHTLVRPPGRIDDPQTGFGVVGADLVPTAALCALSDEWGGTAC